MSRAPNSCSGSGIAGAVPHQPCGDSFTSRTRACPRLGPKISLHVLGQRTTTPFSADDLVNALLAPLDCRTAVLEHVRR